METRIIHPLVIEIAATKLVLRVLVAYLLDDDPKEAEAAIDRMIGMIDSAAKVASVGGEPLANAADAYEAIRSAAISLVADLKPVRFRG